MKVRRCAEACSRLGAEKVDSWEAPESLAPATGATLSPIAQPATTSQAKITDAKGSLFTNITDDEIDRLFENPSS